MDKNKNFYRMYFGKLKTALFCVVIVGSFISMIIEILFLTGVLKSGGNEALYATSLAVLALILILALYVLLASGYIVGKKKFSILFLIPESVDYEHVIEIRYNRILDEYTLVLMKEEGDVQKYSEYVLNINKKYFDAFYAALREKCPSLLYEVHSHSKEDKKNKK